nr:bifunctional hydroxymethylpyrimidine kinase/phosphomethylpyrimidine kinase [Caldisphaeraceae archaeon]
SSYDRRFEPKDVKKKEGASLPWGVSEAIKNSGYKRVEVIIDSGDYGKEPGAIVFGKDPLEVVEKLIAIASRL